MIIFNTTGIRGYGTVISKYDRYTGSLYVNHGVVTIINSKMRISVPLNVVNEIRWTKEIDLRIPA